MTIITSIHDLQCLFKRRLPKMFNDYVDSGSWTESTYRANQSDFQKIKFRQRVAVDMSKRSLSTTMIGQDVSMPVALAPTGLTGMFYADGEMLAAKAAEAMGVPFTLSTMSVCSIEDVASVTTKPFWFQLYMMKDRGFIENLIQRAKDANCSALMLTLDLQILGQRHKDLKNGLSVPPKMTASQIWNMAIKPAWCINMLTTKRHSFRNIEGHVKDAQNLSELSVWTQKQFDEKLSWDDIEWIKQKWGGPLILKGILDSEDAKLAVKSGADALVVSNHGGRQLDGARSSISVLPEILEAVDDQIEVHMDGGIRSGQDALKAVSIGAKGVYIGRSYLYGLGAMGQKGVMKSLEIIRNEMDISMAFCGEKNINNMTREHLYLKDSGLST